MEVAGKIDRPRTARFFILAVIFLLPPLALDSESYYLRIATLILLYGGISSAWNLLGGLANQISLGHAAFFGLGAYTSTMLLHYLTVSPWLGMVAAFGVAGTASLLVGIPAFRLRGHYFALATLTLGEVVRVLFLYFREYTGGAVGLSVPFLGNSFWYFQFPGSTAYYLIALVMIGLTMYLAFRIGRGRLGYQLRALKNSHDAAEVVGVNTYRAKLKIGFLSAGIMGAFGTFYAQYQFFIDPDTTMGFWTISVKVALMSILGGIGTVWGPVLGAAILVPIDEWANAVFTGNLAAVGRLLYGVILIVLILWEPRGILDLLKRGVNRILVKEGEEK
jgi:branched-chain amino acid transport system permease protein